MSRGFYFLQQAKDNSLKFVHDLPFSFAKYIYIAQQRWAAKEKSLKTLLQ